MPRFLVAFALSVLVAASARGQCQPDWLPGDGIPGVNGTVNAVTTWDPDGSGPLPARLVIGGAFTVAGGGFAQNIALWDGARWQPLGSTLTNPVHALAVYNGDLYAGMDQLQTFGGPNIRRWDGDAWQPLGSGIAGHVYAITVYNGELILAGQNLDFPGASANQVAAWNGTSWHVLGQAVQSGIARALTVHDGRLIVGTSGARVGAATLGTVIAWDGSAWSAVGSGMAAASALGEFNGQLVAGTGSGVFAWDGSVWSRLGGAADREVDSLAVWNGQLIAGGMFRSIGPESFGSIAAWDGAAWHSLGSGARGSVLAMTIYNGSLTAGGTFTAAGDHGADGVARWDGADWHALGTGFSSTIYAFAQVGQDLIAGSEYVAPSNPPGTLLSAWDGSSWRPFASGFSPGAAGNPSIDAFAEFNGELVAGGQFSTAGGVPANNIAAFDGQNWRPLGAGVNGRVQALCVYNGWLFVGGAFAAAGGVPTHDIAAWDGANWHTFGAGTTVGTGGVQGVNALAVFNTNLIAAGAFGSIDGTPARNLARWNGSSWTELGGGVGGASDFNLVNALEVFGGKLYVGGHFLEAGAGGTAFLARWNGSDWEEFVTPGGDVQSMATVGNSLVVTGPTLYPGVVVHGITSYDGLHWHALGRGFPFPSSFYPETVGALAEFRGDLVIGGGFMAPGGRISARFARYACSCYANCDGSTTPPVLNINDLLCFLQRFAAGDAYTNCDGSTTPPVLNVNDFLCFQGKFVAGCP